MAKYEIYLTQNIEACDYTEKIGEAETYQEACKTIKKYLANTKLPQTPYWRLLLNSTCTSIDFGSWSTYVAIVPAVSMKELNGD
jgi:hypothetical protein